MKRIFLLLALLAGSVSAQSEFGKYFENKTLRLDFYHTGDKNSEIISFDRLIEEPYFSGSKQNLIDQFNYGFYMLKVFADSSDSLIFSKGFSTLFQEWQTTEEAKHTVKSFPGSVTMPFPKNKIRIEIDRRNKKNDFIKIFEYAADPKSYFIVKERIRPYDSFKVHYAGDPSEKLDIVFLPEGYTKEEMDKFRKDCERFTNDLFSYSPFKENQDKINTWGIDAPSPESGTDIPGENIWKRTLLNSNFYTFDSERYMMTEDFHTVKDIAANAPYDQIYIITNTSKYGGGAIFNFYSMTAAGNRMSNQIFVHEFAHGLAGIADEYGNDATYQDYYPLNVEPWEPNLTTLVNFESKWKDLVEPGTPIPTPALDKYKNKIGVFEGGGYVGKGVYRPTINSIMNSFASNEFNAVCQRVLKKFIDYYSN